MRLDDNCNTMWYINCYIIYKLKNSCDSKRRKGESIYPEKTIRTGEESNIMNIAAEVIKWIERFRSGLCTKEDVHGAIYNFLMFISTCKEVSPK
jgi:hypothetical protein